MNAATYARVSEIFLAVAELPPEERTDLLDRLCAGDDELRRSVEKLLTHDRQTAVVDTPIDAAHVREVVSLGSAAEDLPLPERIGSYEILGVLGHGGMGTVYRARQARPARAVALKVLNPALLTPSMIRRFEFEAQVMADLHHSGIAEIYEAGVADVHHSRVPFFAMELVAGRPLTAYAEASTLDVRSRLSLLRDICGAVHHAHQKGVIHRDLKPGNILVTEAGEPKILDFGIARTTAPDLRNLTLQTRPGQIVGTLPYMSPEQLHGDSKSVDVRSDVYSLGIVAYELLSGRLPHDISGKSLADSVRILEGNEPVPLGRIDRALRGDVETIVAKAMDRDPARRYGSVMDLAREFDRCLAGEAIEARRDSRAYVLAKALRRHRVAVAVAAGFILVLTASAVVSIVFALGEARQRRVAEERTGETRQVARLQSQILRGINAEAMGQGIKALLRERVHAGLLRPRIWDESGQAPRTSEEVDALMAAFDEAAASAVEADVARSVLDDYVLRPASGALQKELAALPTGSAQLHYAIGAAYGDVKMLEPAESHLRTALELQRANLERDDPDLLLTIQALAGVLERDGQYEESEGLYREVLDLVGTKPGVDSVQYAYAQADLATLLSNRGDTATAEALYDKALAKMRTLRGDKSRPVALALSNYAEMLRRKGDMAGAERAHREALAIRQEVLGPEHEEVANSLNNLANLLTECGRYDEALAPQRESLELFRRLRGAEHTDTVTSLHNLANLYRLTGALDDAEAGFREVIALHKRGLGNANELGLARTLTGLGLVLQAKRDFAEGEPLLRESVRIFSRLGSKHPDYAIALGNLAAILHAKGDLDGAAPVYREALEMRRGLPNAEHMDVATLLNNYAALLRDRKEYSTAEPAYVEALAMLRKIAPDHPALSVTLAGLARVLVGLGRDAEAEPLFRESVTIQVQSLPAGPLAGQSAGQAQLNLTNARLGATLVRLKRYQEAEKLLNPIAGRPDDAGAVDAAALLAIETLAGMYESWDAADGGHSTEAGAWRARLAGARQVAGQN